MSLVTAFITENGNPLRRAYVEHIAFGISIGIAITDNNGSFQFEAGPLANQIDIRIHAQNTVVRVVNGDRFNTGISINKRVANGDQINIISTTDFWDQFRILNIMQEVYDKVWRAYVPYSRSSRGDFSLGLTNNNIRSTFASNKRIELSFPDHFNPDPNSANWVEPAGAANAMQPLMHIRNESTATVSPLFSTPKNAWGVLSHEAGHAFHFAAFPEVKRVEIETRYLAYILSHIGNAGHDLDVATDPFIAYIEAVAEFSQRFFFFATFIKPNLAGSDLRRAFTRDELGIHEMRDSRDINVPNFQHVAETNGNSFTPLITGNNKEGAVYGAIFLDFGKRIGLKAAVNYVLASGATTFAEFRSHVIGKNVAAHTAAINEVRTTWEM
ncbi:MAG: hypothetical protein WAU23_02570 [Ferruginibacter sp.]